MPKESTLFWEMAFYIFSFPSGKFKRGVRQYVQTSITMLYNLLLFHPKLRSYFQDTREGTRRLWLNVFQQQD